MQIRQHPTRSWHHSRSCDGCRSPQHRCTRNTKPETELKTRVQIITELATLNTVVGAFEFDSVVGSVHDMQAEHDPMVAGQVYASVADIGRLAVAVKQLLLEVEDRFLVFVGRDNDRFLSCTGLLEANREFAVCAAP